MKRLFKIAIAGIVLLGIAMCSKDAFAAQPLGFAVYQVEAFRHVLESNDLLVMGRVYLTPETSTAYTDVFSISTTDGDFDDVAVLTNRVDVTGTTDYTVTADTTDITDYCALQQDEQTINCESTGLANATYDVTIVYRSGWAAYSPDDVTIRLYNSTTIVAERNASRVGYGLTGIYLTAAEVTAASITWGSANVTLRVLASPAFWDTPTAMSVAISAWHTSASVTATASLLDAQLKTALASIEQSDPDVGHGDYVQDYITDAGAVIAREAFSLFKLVIPNAFASSVVNPVPTPITTPSQSTIDAIETDIQATDVYGYIQAINPAAGLFISLLVSIVAGGALWWKGNAYIGVMGWYVILFACWLVFAIPAAWVVLPACGLAAAGFVYFVKKVFD